MNKILYATTTYIFLFATSVFAAEYDCVVNKKISSERNYSAQQIKQAAFKVKIRDKSEETKLSRCSYSLIDQKNTCDEYPVDKVVYDEYVKIKKFYVFDSQFDVQLFPNMTFIENNGRGGIAYGKCSITSP